MAKIDYLRQRGIKLGVPFALVLFAGAMNASAAELWRNDRWVVSSTGPVNGEEISGCILQPRLSLSEFKFVWDEDRRATFLRLNLDFNLLATEDYERNNQILVQFDRGNPVSLEGTLNEVDDSYEGSIRDPRDFFAAASKASTMAVGTEEMGFIIHQMKGSAKAISAFLDCAEARQVGEKVVKLPYGTRIGMDVTVESMTGIDSSLAEIKIVHTAHNAAAFCTEYLNDSSSACVEKTLREVKVEDRVMASCSAGEFTDPSGARYRFEGRNREQDQGEFGEFRIVEMKSGEPLTFNSASGYDIAFAAFSALCPARLKK